MENTSILEKKPQKIYLKPILVFIGCFMAEAIVQILSLIAIPSTNPYRTVIAWGISKLVPLIIILIFMKDVFKHSAQGVKQNTGRFFLFLVIGFIAFYAVEVGTSYYSMFMDKLFGTGEATNQASIIEIFKSNPTTVNYVVLFLIIVVMAPVLEELEFRACAFEGLKGLHYAIPLVIGSTLFGFVHMASLFDLKEWAYFPMYALPGFAMGLVYYFSGRNIFTNIFCHMGINFISFIQIVIMVNKAVEVVEL